jgi:hypothetical protein
MICPHRRFSLAHRGGKCCSKLLILTLRGPAAMVSPILNYLQGLD